MYLKQIKLAVYCLIALLPNITNADTQDCPTLKYTARWVDIYNVAFYTNNFDVAIKRHNNLTSYVSPSYTGDCLYCIPGMPNTTESIQNAINQWNNVQNTTINLVLNSGTSSSSKIVDPNDGVNLIGFETPNDNAFADGTSILAICRLHLPVTAYNCDNALKPYVGSGGADIIFNPDKPWDFISGTEATEYSKYTYYDFESVVLHELGHSMGLGHTPEDANAMFGTTYNANIKRNLGNCDIKALQDIYPYLASLQLACSSFSQKEDDLLGQNPGTGTGGGTNVSNNCRIINNPNHFSLDARKGIIQFYYDYKIRNNINKFRAQIATNQTQFDEILTSTDPRYRLIQDALQRAVTANKALVESTFAKNEHPIVTSANLDPICAFLNELLPLISDVAFKNEIVRFKKGLSMMKNQELKQGLFTYDQQQDFNNINLYSCGGSSKTDWSTYQLALQNIDNAQLILNYSGDGFSGNEISFVIYNLNGQIAYQQQPTTQNTFTVDINNLAKGIYFVKTFANGENVIQTQKFVVF